MKTFVDAQIKHAPSNLKPRRASRAINPLVTCAVIAFVGFLASIACAVPSFAQIVGTVQLNIERRGHTATLLEDGKVLIVGGDNQSGIVNQVELLDPASQTSSLAAMPIVARTDHAAIKLDDGRVLIIGGHDRNGSLTSTEIYNPLTAKFTAGPSLTTPRSGHTATVLANGNILVAGGDASGSAELYNPTTQRFSLIAGSMNTARKFQSAILLNNGQVLIAGGVGAQNNVLNTAEVYDPSSQSFYVPPTDMQTPRALAMLKLLSDGKVQIIGGDAELSMEVFDPTNGIFIAKALLPPNADLLGATLSTQSRAALFSPTISQDPLLQGVLTPEQLALLDRADHSITELPSRNQALVAGGINSAGQTFNSATLVSSSTASVTTDKTDYAPGEIVTIIGGGFQPNEQVQLSLHEFPEAYPDITFTAVANQQGNFVATDFAPQLIDLDRIFTLTAIGQSSGFTAQTAFKDAAKTTSTSVSCSPSSVGIGSSSTCTATVTNTGTGNNTPDGTVNFTSSGSGTFTASSSCTLPSNPGNNLASCSVAYTPSSGAGTHTITGTYVPANTANFSGSAGGFGLTVTATGTAPTITSSNNTTFTVGTAGSFTVTTTGSPTPAITKTGTLPTGITFIDNSNGTATLSGTPALGTVSSYPITFTANNGVSPNATQNFILTVERANQATLTVNTPATLTYGNKATLTASGGNGNGAVTFSTGASTGCSVAGDQLSVTNASGNCSVTASKAADDNYKVANSAAAVVTLLKIDATIAVTGYNGPYTATAHGATGTATGLGGANLNSLLHVDATTYTDVPGGLVHWTFDGNTNYNSAFGDATVTITKIDATIAVTGYNGPYTATAHGATGTATGLGGANLNSLLHVDATTYTDVPGGLVHWTFDGNTNYNSAFGDATVTITKIDATIAVTGYNGPYTATAHGATGTATGLGGANLNSLLHVDATTYTDVPGGLVHWTFDGNTNYNSAFGDATVTITKIDATIAVTGYNGPYTATAHGATGTATGLGGANLNSLLHVDATTYTDVPGGLVHWTFDGNTNYNSAFGDATVTITKIDATIAVTGYNGPYTATAHGATGTATGLGGANLNSLLHVDATTYTDVPGGLVHWTFDGNTNYNSAFGDATVTITKATSTTTVTGGTFTYDGNPHRATVSVTGAGLNLTPTPSYSGGCSAAPVYVYETTPTPCTASYTYAGDTNHTGSSGSDTIIITTAFAFNGFYSPIGGSVENGNGGTFNDPVRTFKLGSTIPVKFGATWLNGGAPLITGIHTLQAVKYSNATDSDAPIDATPTDAATTGNQFRLTSPDWHFNLSTKGFSAGTWLLIATLEDGSRHTVWISIKK